MAVYAPSSGESAANVRMLIDSGADVTLLPQGPLTHLLDDVSNGDQYELEGFDGTRSTAPAVQLELHFLGRVFRGQFLLIDQAYGILGRNVLNAVSLTMDGPNRQWRET